MRLSFADAQRNVAEIANRESYSKDVIFELLAAYGRSAASITKLRNGTLNLAQDQEHDVLQRGVVYFKHVPNKNLLSVVDSLDQDPLVVRYNPRYLIATDYEQLVAKDTKKDTTLDIKLRDIDRSVDFFYGWTGDEVTSEKTEAVADRRAADKMKDLYAEIEKINHKKLLDPKSTFRHDLNVFFSRLLFCFFAEDTKVFSKEEKTIFTSSIKDYTLTDGSDLDEFLETLFKALDTEDKSGFTSPFSKFPYVNGTIFDTKKHNIAIPKFNAQARKLILDCGNQNWAAINPDIFGSMFQSIVDEEHRSNHGMHYTSVPNIMKTIEPLFLDEIREDFDKYYDEPKKLEKLWDRISKIKIFDPACGSGNFLIIAYKELRKIEHGIIDRLFSDDYKRAMVSGKLESRIKLDNFYGIEIDDFAHEIAILSLYLAKHQMNIEFEQHFGKEIVLIPLKDNAKVVHGNSASLDWQDVCPNKPQKLNIPNTKQATLIEIEGEQEELDLSKEEWDEIYLIGNPPYEGSRSQETQMKLDMKEVLGDIQGYKVLDYVAIWLLKGVRYIGESPNTKLAFVVTNSVNQGQQVPILWPNITKEYSIFFAHSSFKWTNSARNPAGVYCAVIGLCKRDTKKVKKVIYDGGIATTADNINSYLVDSDEMYVQPLGNPVSFQLRMQRGSELGDNKGGLVVSFNERERLIKTYPTLDKYLIELVNADTFLNGRQKFGLWLEGAPEDILNIQDVKKRILQVTEVRPNNPTQFSRINRPKSQYLFVPQLSSENREYIPVGFKSSNTVPLGPHFFIDGATEYEFAILSSRMHMAWMRSVSGKFKQDYRYSSTLVYNTFPIGVISDMARTRLIELARRVIFIRENHSEKTLSQMYKRSSMPEDLQEAHHDLDLAVDRLYSPKPYSNDEERLSDLFAMYEQMTKMEKQK